MRKFIYRIPFIRSGDGKSVNWFAVMVVLFMFVVIPLSCMRTFKTDTKPVESSEISKDSKDSETTELVRPDFTAFKNITKRKTAFFKYLRPIVREENTRISRDRQRLLSLYVKNTENPGLSEKDRKWLKHLGEEYGVNVKFKDDNTWRKLIRRVDIVPERIALVQAAVESKWGTSRFAVKGNSFFGEWCFTKDCGIVPKKREEGKYHEVKSFNSVRQSVQSYLMNLNTHPAYWSFRTRRYVLRLQGKPLVGSMLVPGLLQYSERRDDYVQQIRNMMEQNRNLLDG